MQTTFYPQLAYRIDGGRTPRAVAPRSLARATRHPGDWRYDGVGKSSRLGWTLAVLVSAGLHLGVLWGLGHRVKVAPKAVVHEEAIVQMVMPPLADEEEPPPSELQAEEEQLPAMSVPQLADLPSVDVSATFVQSLDMNVPLQTNLDGAKISTIPLHIGNGQKLSGLKNVFDVSQLDRIPEPVAQPAPQFPFELKATVDQAQVVVEFIVDTTGSTRDVRVLSSTHSGFERSSVDAVAKWRFRPGMKGGRKVNTRMMVPIRFTVEEN